MTPSSAIRVGDWKLIHRYEDDSVELFNLATDPSESQELAATHPEQARNLRIELDRWLKEVGANAPM